MTEAKIPKCCPSCDAALQIKQLECGDCGTRLQGSFALPRLARLDSSDQRFIEQFIICSGSLKTMSKELSVSYPTVRKRLDALVLRLEHEIKQDESDREQLIQDIREGNLTAEEAIKKLRESR